MVPRAPSQLTAEHSTAKRVDHLERRASEALASHPHFVGRSAVLQLENDGKYLVVSGSLPSFYLKQLVQEVLMRVDGVERIDNRIDVVQCNGLSSPPVTEPERTGFRAAEKRK